MHDLATALSKIALIDCALMETPTNILNTAHNNTIPTLLLYHFYGGKKKNGYTSSDEQEETILQTN